MWLNEPGRQPRAGLAKGSCSQVSETLGPRQRKQSSSKGGRILAEFNRGAAERFCGYLSGRLGLRAALVLGSHAPLHIQEGLGTVLKARAQHGTERGLAATKSEAQAGSY